MKVLKSPMKERPIVTFGSFKEKSPRMSITQKSTAISSVKTPKKSFIRTISRTNTYKVLS